MPQFDRAELAALYLPGSSEASVGGDWYDAIALDDTTIGLVIGDVVGRGVRAASAMGQLRNAVRAYLLEGYGPAQTLARVNRLLDTLGGGFATLACLCVDTETGALRYANAGHPPPLIVGPDGATRWLEGGLAPPIGAAREIAYREAEDAIPAGGALVLYTDGLVERRGEPIDTGLGRLAEAAADSPGHAATLAAPARGRDARHRAARRRRRAGALAPRGRRRAARRAPARRGDVARPAARAAAPLAGRRGPEPRARPATCCWPSARRPRTRSSIRSSPSPAGGRRHARARTPTARRASRSATTAAGTPRRPQPHRGRGMQIMRAIAGEDMAIDRTRAGHDRHDPAQEGGAQRMSQLEFDTEPLPAALVARPLGDVDMAVTPALQADLLAAVGEHGAGCLVVDLGDGRVHRQLGHRAAVPPARRARRATAPT